MANSNFCREAVGKLPSSEFKFLHGNCWQVAKGLISGFNSDLWSLGNVPDWWRHRYMWRHRHIDLVIIDLWPSDYWSCMNGRRSGVVTSLWQSGVPFDLLTLVINVWPTGGTFDVDRWPNGLWRHCAKVGPKWPWLRFAENCGKVGTVAKWVPKTVPKWYCAIVGPLTTSIPFQIYPILY